MNSTAALAHEVAARQSARSLAISRLRWNRRVACQVTSDVTVGGTPQLLATQTSPEAAGVAGNLAPPPPGASGPEGAAVHFVTLFRKSEAISSACVLVTESRVLGSTRLQGGGQLSSTSWRERGQGAWERILKSPSSPLTFRT